MQVESKYYTPAISEFCVGFIYEAFIPERNCWSVEIFHLNYSHMALIRQNKVRVKYLDIEDVESLGWKEFSEAPYAIQDKGVCWYLWITSGRISINKGLVGDLIKDSIQMFRGSCKNKSELRRLMQQLSIAQT